MAEKKSLFNFPTEVHMGREAAKVLPEAAARFGNKAILLTSRRQFQDSDIIEKVSQSLTAKNFNVLVYDEIGLEADSKECDEIASLAKSSRCEFVIGLGGDVVLNGAKAVALLCSNPGETSDYLTEQDGYRLNIARAPIPSIMIPTAFGTLCETTPGFVIKDHADGIRKKLYNSRVLPSCAIIDPQMTRSVSRKYLSASGLLVLALAIELYLSPEANVVSDGFVQKTLELVNGYLVALNRDPDNMDLRGQLMNASLLLSYGASCCPLGPIYALMEAITSRATVYKGSLASVLLPQFMEYNLTASPGRYVQIVRLLGEDVSKISVLEAAIKAVERVRLYVEEFNIPTRLGDLDVNRSDLEDISQIFFRFEESKNNTRPIGQDDLRVIVDQSM